MSDYFDELGCQPLADGETPDHLLHLARLLRDFNVFEPLLEEKLAPAASTEVVNKLEKIRVQSDNNLKGQTCAICMKTFIVDDQTTHLPCKHYFHEECISPWLSKTNSCPVCRYELPTDDEDYEAFRKEKERSKARKLDLDNLHNSMFS